MHQNPPLASLCVATTLWVAFITFIIVAFNYAINETAACCNDFIYATLATLVYKALENTVYVWCIKPRQENPEPNAWYFLFVRFPFFIALLVLLPHTADCNKHWSLVSLIVVACLFVIEEGVLILLLAINTVHGCYA